MTASEITAQFDNWGIVRVPMDGAAFAAFVADQYSAWAPTILTVAEASRRDHPEPPDGPKALDRAMQRAAQRLKQSGAPIAQKFAANGKGRSVQGKSHHRPTPSADEKAAFYADLVNSDRFLPANTISNTIRDAMLARGLVTPERLRERGVR